MGRNWWDDSSPVATAPEVKSLATQQSTAPTQPATGWWDAAEPIPTDPSVQGLIQQAQAQQPLPAGQSAALRGAIAQAGIPQSPEWWAQRRQESAMAVADQTSPVISRAPALIREPYYATAQAGANIGSTIARPFSKDAADYLAETGKDISTEAEAARAKDWMPWLSRMYGGAAESLVQGAVASPLGAYGIIGSFAATEGNQALYDAEQAGLKGADRIKYAVVQGAIEGSIAAALQKVAPGLSLPNFIKDVAGGAMKTSGAQFLKMVLAEVPEEVLTEVGHAVTEATYGVNPEALNSEQFWPRMRDTVAQTLLTVGLAHGAAKVSQLRQQANDINVITGKGFVSKQDAEKLGIPPDGSRKDRMKAAEELKQQKQKQADEIEKSIQENKPTQQKQPGPPANPQEGEIYKSPGGTTHVFTNGNWETQPQGASNEVRKGVQNAPQGQNEVQPGSEPQAQQTNPEVQPPVAEATPAQPPPDFDKQATDAILQNHDGDSRYITEYLTRAIDNAEQQGYQAVYDFITNGKVEKSVPVDRNLRDAKGQPWGNMWIINGSARVRFVPKEQQAAPQAPTQPTEAKPLQKYHQQLSHLPETILQNTPIQRVQQSKAKGERADATAMYEHQTGTLHVLDEKSPEFQSELENEVIAAWAWKHLTPEQYSEWRQETGKPASKDVRGGVGGGMSNVDSFAVSVQDWLAGNPQGNSGPFFEKLFNATTQPQTASESVSAPEAVPPKETLPAKPQEAQPTQKSKGVREQDEGRPEVMLGEGETATTSSGRQTTPFPKVDTGSHRRAGNTVKRVDQWLWENAVAEARSRGDDFNLRQFENEDPARLPQATKDSMNEYLFGQQPDVIPKANKEIGQKEQSDKNRYVSESPQPFPSQTTEKPASKIGNIDIKHVEQAFPGATIAVAKEGQGWDVHLRTGDKVQIRFKDQTVFTPEQRARAEKRYGEKFAADAEYYGRFEFITRGGEGVPSVSLIELNSRLATPEHLKHEDFHRLVKMAPQSVVDSLEKKYAKGVKKSQREEVIVRRLTEDSEGRGTFIGKMKEFIGQLLRSTGLGDMSEADALRWIESMKTAEGASKAPIQPQNAPESVPAPEVVPPSETPPEAAQGTPAAPKSTGLKAQPAEVAQATTYAQRYFANHPKATNHQVVAHAKRNGLDHRQFLKDFQAARAAHKATLPSTKLTGEALEEARRKSAEGERLRKLRQRREQKSQERFDAEVESIHAAMLAAGWKLDKESESGSRYYSRGNELARVSDHAANPATQAWIDKNGVREISRLEDVPKSTGVKEKPVQSPQLAHVNTLREAGRQAGEPTTVYKNRKGQMLVVREDATGSGRVVVERDGSSNYIGAGPVDESKWTPVSEAELAKTKRVRKPAKKIEDDLKAEHVESLPGQKKLGMSGGNAMAALTEGDSYQPVEPETETEQETPESKPKIGQRSAPQKVVADLVGMASPAHVSDVSREAGHAMREEMARAAQWDEAHLAALRKMERKFYFMSPEAAHEFIDRLEAGEQQETPELDEIAQALRTERDKGRDRLRALGKLQDFYENYFPHLWKDVRKASETIRSISAGKPWRSSGFLKERTHITMKEGREAGLVPISDNPIEMALLRLHQVNKYVARTHIMERLKQAGMMKFVPESLDKSYMPSGYEYYDDPAFRVVTDPSITMEEAYDKLLVDQLSAVLARMGVKHERVAEMARGKWGESKEGQGIKTRYAGPVSVLAHELGHQIGDIFGLYDYLTKGAPVEGRRFKTGERAGQEVKADAQRKRAQMNRELRALADLRVEGQPEDVAENTKQYRRKKAEKEAVILEAWLAAPDKMAEVAPMVTEAWKDFLKANEPVAPLLNLDRSVVLGTRKQEINQPGVLQLGKWAMPSDVARMVKNMLSPGLRSNPNAVVKGLWNLSRVMGNSMNQASLSLSAFHGLFVLKEAVDSQMALGMQQLLRSKPQFGRAVWNMVTAPAAGIIGAVKGGMLRKAAQTDLSLLSPEDRAFVTNMLEAGARASMDPVYHNYGVRRVAESIRKLMYGSALQKVDASIRLPVQTILTGLEMTAKPLMEWMVPNIKLYAFYKMNQDIYDRANIEGLSDFQRREQLSQAWDSVDNRLGQLAYDNLFWNQYLKDVAMLSVRSVGWNLGSFREYGGAVVDVSQTPARLRRGDQILSRKMAYAITSTITSATIGALVMYALTGKPPEEWKDYFFPKTGKTNPDGSPERLSLPNYSKDIAAWWMQPLKTAEHKLHPMWGTMTDVLTNEDYYGVKIRNEDDPWYVQLEDTMKHVGESFVPFSVKNMQRFIDAGEDPKLAIPMALSGITSAPAYISRSPAQKLAYDLMIENMPQGSKTTAQAEASQQRKAIVQRLREGGQLTEDEIKQYSKQQLTLINKEASQTSFQTVVSRLSPEQSMKVWGLANDKEKDQIRKPLQIRFVKQASDRGESANERDKALNAIGYLSQIGITTFEQAKQVLDDIPGTELKLKTYNARVAQLEVLYGRQP